MWMLVQLTFALLLLQSHLSCSQASSLLPVLLPEWLWSLHRREDVLFHDFMGSGQHQHSGQACQVARVQFALLLMEAHQHHLVLYPHGLFWRCTVQGQPALRPASSLAGGCLAT